MLLARGMVLGRLTRPARPTQPVSQRWPAMPTRWPPAIPTHWPPAIPLAGWTRPGLTWLWQLQGP